MTGKKSPTILLDLRWPYKILHLIVKELLYRSLPERGFPGSHFPLALSETPLAVTDSTNVLLPPFCFFKNVTVFSKTWDGLRKVMGRLVVFPRKHLGFWDGVRRMVWRTVENGWCLTLFLRVDLFATSDPPRFSLCGTSISPRIDLGIRGPVLGISSLGPRN